jgi:hypothetical protein
MAAKKKKSIGSKRSAASRVWVIPAGPLIKFLESRLNALTDDGERFNYAIAALLDDVDEFLEDIAADLAAFKAQGMPITQRNFELLQLYLDELAKVGVFRRLDKTSTKTVSDKVADAMAEVIRARNALADRAAANGISKSGFDVRRAAGSPKALWRAALEVQDFAKEVVEDFDNPAYARKLIANLKTANDALGEVAGVRREAGVMRGKANKRKRLLVRSLYQYAVWLSGFGRAMAGDDPEAQRRWRLDKTFPNQDRVAPAADVDAVVRAATVDPVDPNDADDN